MNKCLSCLLAFACLLPSAPLTAQSITAHDFFKFGDFDDIKISPDGLHLAMTIPREVQSMIIIMRIDNNEITAKFSTPKQRKIGQFIWANNERILFSPLTLTGSLESPYRTGEIHGLNIDDTQKFMLVGPTRADRAVYYMSGNPLVDPDHIRVTSKDWSQIRRGSSARARATSHLLDINDRPIINPSIRESVISPLPYGELYADNDGVVRLATALSDTARLQVQYRKDAKSEWKDMSELFEQQESFSDIQLQGFSADNNSFYGLEYTASGTLGLVQYFPDSLQKTVIYSNPNFDMELGNLVVAADETTILGVKFFGDVIERHYISDHPDVKLHQSLDAAFPEDLVTVTSKTRDGSRAVIFVRGPRRVGDYYLLETASMQVTKIGSHNSEIDRNQMADVRPFIIRNREGLTLHGIVTIPVNETESMPMIVIPHGGPIGVRDTIAFNSEAQFFAHHGYVVLQVNYRGSGGYGVDLHARLTHF